MNYESKDLRLKMPNELKRFVRALQTNIGRIKYQNTRFSINFITLLMKSSSTTDNPMTSPLQPIS